MDMKLEFTYRHARRTCDAYIDTSAYPFYVFIDLLDVELSAEFGSEISLKTNGQTLLQRDDDYPDLVALRQAILNAICSTTQLAGSANAGAVPASGTSQLSGYPARNPPQ